MKPKKRIILETATTLFSKSGFGSVGIDEIVAKSNAAKMTLYSHFPSKDFLIESVLLQHDHDLQISINAAMGKHQTASGKLKAIFDWHGDWFASAKFYGCMFVKASHEFPNNNSKIKQVAQNHKAWLEGVIINHLKALNVKASAEVAACILAILDGLTVRSNIFKGNAKGLVDSSWVYIEAMIKADPKNTLA